MGGLATRRVAVTVLLALLVVFAGCNGGGDGTTTPGTDTTVQETETTVPGTDTTEPGTAGAPQTEMSQDSRNESTRQVSESYTFETNEGYLYDVSTSNGSFRVGWITESVGEDSLTINVSAGTGSQIGSMNVTADRDEPFAPVFRSSRPGALFFLLRMPIRAAGNQSLSAGETWTVTSDELAPEAPGSVAWDTATVSVGQEESVNGVPCHTVTIDPENTSSTVTACIEEGWPFALSVTDGSDDGTEIVLADSHRP